MKQELLFTNSKHFKIDQFQVSKLNSYMHWEMSNAKRPKRRPYWTWNPQIYLSTVNGHNGKDGNIAIKVGSKKKMQTQVKQRNEISKFIK